MLNISILNHNSMSFLLGFELQNQKQYALHKYHYMKLQRTNNASNFLYTCCVVYNHEIRTCLLPRPELLLQLRTGGLLLQLRTGRLPGHSSGRVFFLGN